MFAYVGSFTSQKRGAHGKGISVYRIDRPGGDWTLLQELETLPNPGFLALDHDSRFLYSSHGDEGEVCAFSIDKSTGRIALLNKQPTKGNNGSFLTPDPSNRYIVAATGPGVAVYPVNKDGSLAPATDIVVAPGEVAPDPRRKNQTHSHPHQVLFDPSGRFLLVPDHGIDKIHVYRLDTASGKLAVNDPPFLASRAGAQPRHVIFHPTRPLAYVINELESSVSTYNWDTERGEFKFLQEVPATPSTFSGENKPSEIMIAPSGNFVFLSNRGHDSITTYRVDSRSGTLEAIYWEPTQGDKPRFATLDPSGNFLYAANEGSNTIVTFRVDGTTGKLTPTGQIVKTGTPTCIVFSG